MRRAVAGRYTVGGWGGMSNTGTVETIARVGLRFRFGGIRTSSALLAGLGQCHNRRPSKHVSPIAQLRSHKLQDWVARRATGARKRSKTEQPHASLCHPRQHIRQQSRARQNDQNKYTGTKKKITPHSFIPGKPISTYCTHVPSDTLL